MKRFCILACVIITGCGAGGNSTTETSLPASNLDRESTVYDTEIRWTSFGIPHVKANDWGSLGYGFAYATANDGICVIAKDVLMVNGQLSEYFGAGKSNRESDVFYRSVLTTNLSEDFLSVQTPKSLEFSEGYMKGYNRYLKDNADSLPISCAGKKWVQKISAEDIVRLNIGVGIRYGVGRYMKNMSDAMPPGQQIVVRHADFSGFDGIGSNAVALGSDVTESGRGILFGNPHYPWSGSSRFHMIHTTLPGELDVMGVSLMNTSRIAIGFNKDIAWTHTVSTALRATIYQLELNPENPMQYRYGDEFRNIEYRVVNIDVLGKEGALSKESHNVYLSHYGPVVVSKELPWNAKNAYAVKDANLRNFQSATTYDALNQARNIDEVETAISRQGVAFTNTIAADRHGTAYYADISVTPNVDKALFDSCRLEVDGIPGKLVVLNGSKTTCEWKDDARSNVDNTLPPQDMPRLRRTDYVTNSNNSYWLSNPKEPLEGYSPIIGSEKTARSLRTRAGLTLVDALIAKGKVKPADVQNMLYSQRNFGAELLLDDLLVFCKEASAEISRACKVLGGWDRKQNIDSRGAQVWTEFWRNARKIKNLYSVPFDAEHPVVTPRGLALKNETVKSAVHQALKTAQQTLDDAGIGLDSPWGEVQFSERNGKRIPIPGGQGWAGMFSMIMADLEKNKGYTPIIHGNSYIQVISWDKAGKLDARGILTYSQSQEPDSAHYSDQTELYSQGKWLSFPFTEQEIMSDPNLAIIHLTE